MNKRSNSQTTKHKDYVISPFLISLERIVNLYVAEISQILGISVILLIHKKRFWVA